MCKCTGKGSQKDINVTPALSCALRDLYCTRWIQAGAIHVFVRAQGASPSSGIRCSGTSRARAGSVSGHVLTGHESANNPQKGLNVQTIIRWILSRD